MKTALNLVVIYIFLFFAPSLLFASPGTLDLSFNNGTGFVSTNVGSASATGRSVVTQQDGKIIVIGDSNNGSNFDFTLLRYNADGSLDSTFDEDGIVTTDLSNSQDWPQALAVQSDGKILAAGYTYDGTQNKLVLLRYNVDGSLDIGFGNSGIIAFGHNGMAKAYGIKIQVDGKILVAGTTGNSNNDFILVRFNSDGSNDTSFNSLGWVSTDVLSYWDEGKDVALQSDGKIVVAGTVNGGGSGQDVALVRYESNGSLDSSFGTNGIVMTDIGGADNYLSSLEIQNDGKLIIVCSSNNLNDEIVLVRYNPDGSLDSSFDQDGVVTTNLGNKPDFGNDLILQEDGKVLVVGYSQSDTYYNQLAIVRYNPNGSIDTQFGNGGIVIQATPNGSILGEGVVLQPDGKILITGYINENSTQSIFLARYLAYADSDGDGVSDNIDAFPNDPTETTDTDGDGVGDVADNCTFLSNPSQIDLDENGIGDICESVATLSDGYYGFDYLDDAATTGGTSDTGFISFNFDGSSLGTGEFLSVTWEESTPQFPYTYSILDDNTFIIDYGFDENIGTISSNRNYIVMSDADPAGDSLGMTTVLRQGSGMTNASLSSDYAVVRIMDESVSGPRNVSISWIDFSFDGAGNASYTTTARSVGANDSGSNTYTVADDGSISFSTLGDGAVSVDSSVIGIVDTSLSAGTDDSIHKMVGVKRGTSMTTADLYGAFVIHQVGNVFGSDTTYTERTRVVFDGAGGFIATELASSGGSLESGSGVYSVTADGSIFIDGSFEGVVAADGQSVVLANTDTDADTWVGINFGVKTSVPESAHTVVFQTLHNKYVAGSGGSYVGSVGLELNGSPANAANFVDASITNSSGSVMTTIEPPSLVAYSYVETLCQTLPCTWGTVNESDVSFKLSALPLDDYTVTVNMTDGSLSTVIPFGEDVTLPVVDSATMQSSWQNGELQLSWTNPAAQPNWNRVTALRIGIYDSNSKFVGWIKTTSTTESLTLPAALVQDIKNIGDGTLASWEIQTRLYSGNNSNSQIARSQSLKVDIVNPDTESDFNADLTSDILYQHSDDGRLLIWEMNNFARTVKFPKPLAYNWDVVGNGDFNGDGTTDVLYMRDIGETAIAEILNSARNNLAFPGGINPVWSVQGVGDFNGDGTDDILWRRSTDGVTMVWGIVNSARAKVSWPGGLATFWDIVGIGDFDSDGIDDILCQHNSDGRLLIWKMNNYGRAAVKLPQSLASTWTVVGVGDFNADGTDDVLYRKDTGDTAVAEFANLNRSALKFPGGIGLPWSVQDVGDYNGDGTDDIFFRRTSDGVTLAWGIVNSARAKVAWPGGLATQWVVQ